jgi:hypothetical protein
VTSYKFLAKGAIGPLSGHTWPEPGRWLEASGPLVVCSRGIHVCRPQDLAHWLHDELWQVETEGEALEALDCTVVRRARLVRRIDAWSTGGAARFAEACIEHAQALDGAAAFIDDARMARAAGYLAVSAFCSALAVAELDPGAVTERAFRRERIWQAGWITRELIASSAL